MRNQYDDSERQPILSNAFAAPPLDWESFKRKYYPQEQLIKQALDDLRKQSNETSRKLAMLDDSENLLDLDPEDARKQLHQIHLNKESLVLITELMAQMKQLLSEIQIDPSESQIVLKQSILKRFREIHDENEKELKRIREPFEFNLKKYELFKESFSRDKQKLDKQKYDRDEIKHNRTLKRVLDHTDSVIEYQINAIQRMARTVHGQFVSQGERLGGIQTRMTEMIGGFTDINQLIRSIRTTKVRNQLMLLVLVIVLLLILFYMVFVG